jgi:HlyD family secretion protein
MKSKRFPIWLLLAALGTLVLLGWALRPRAIRIDTAAVVRGPLTIEVAEEGRTRIRQRYVISAPLAGRLLRVTLRPGDAVEAGQTVVATLEPAESALLDPRTQAQAEARVKAAEAEQARTAPLLQRAQSEHAYARTDLERARGLHAQAGVSHQELDAAERREAAAAAELRSAEFAQRIADYEVELARAALLSPDARTTGNDARRQLRAPVSGRVLRVFEESATVVPAGARLVEIGDPSDLEVVIETLSTDAVRVPLGARVRVEQWGGNDALSARVRVIEPSGFTKVSALGVEEQRVNVIADLTTPAEHRRTLGDGFRVEARIVVDEAAAVLKVPVAALFRQNDRWAVFVAQAGRARLRTVDLGRRNEQDAEVLGGLSDADVVVLHPGDSVREGRRLRPR